MDSNLGENVDKTNVLKRPFGKTDGGENLSTFIGDIDKVGQVEYGDSQRLEQLQNFSSINKVLAMMRIGCYPERFMMNWEGHSMLCQ